MYSILMYVYVAHKYIYFQTSDIFFFKWACKAKKFKAGTPVYIYIRSQSKEEGPTATMLYVPT